MVQDIEENSSSNNSNSSSNNWLNNKSVIVALGSFLFIQTSGAIWWAASISRDVQASREDVKQLRLDAYTRLEAQLQIQNRDLRLDNMTTRIITTEQRIVELERSMSRNNNIPGRYQ